MDDQLSHHHHHQRNSQFTVAAADLHHFFDVAANRPRTRYPSPPPPPPPPPPSLAPAAVFLQNPPYLDFSMSRSHFLPLDLHQGHQQQHSFDTLNMGLGRHGSDVLPPGIEMGLGLHDFGCHNSTMMNDDDVVVAAAAASSGGGGGSGNFGGFDPAEGGGGGGEGVGFGSVVDGGNSARWPKEETDILIKIRYKLRFKFREANQKGPLWEEVASIMHNEYGYVRNGKKCREKFENLYKYHKKTRKKAGRDGKNYRFHDLLEAIFTFESGINNNKSGPSNPADAHVIPGNDVGTGRATMVVHHNAAAVGTSTSRNQLQTVGLLSGDCSLISCSPSNSSDFDTTTSSDDRGAGSAGEQQQQQKMMNNNKAMRRRRRNWSEKLKEMLDSQMRRLVDKQELWMDDMMKTFEHNEQERLQREEAWRKQEAERVDREHEFWVNERSWIETRDAAFMEALEKLTNNKATTCHHHHVSTSDQIDPNPNPNPNPNPPPHDHEDTSNWLEPETATLIQLRTRMDSRFQQYYYRGSDQSTTTSEDPDQNLWEEIASKMACSGYYRSAAMCKQKWKMMISRCFIMKNNRKRKEQYHWRNNNNSSSSNNNNIADHYHNNNMNIDMADHLYNQDHHGNGMLSGEINDEEGNMAAVPMPEAPHHHHHHHHHGGNVVNFMGDCCSRFMINQLQGDQNAWKSTTTAQQGIDQDQNQSVVASTMHGSD
ncbi:hypothetical protein Dimus_034725 [Dionaea muscipula]